MSIYTTEFQPTYLYIKQHSVTRKLYFGKTVRDPEIYNGSGTHWKQHIKKHGKEHVVTLWYCLFLDKETIEEFAVMFSNQENIVESNQWLNLRLENGLEGVDTSKTDNYIKSLPKMKHIGSKNGMFGKSAMKGKHHSIDTKLKQQKTKKNMWADKNSNYHKRPDIFGTNNPMFGKIPSNAIPIKFQNIEYPSLAAASRATGKSSKFIKKHRNQN